MKVTINLLQETQQIQARLKRIGLVIQSASIVVLVVFSGLAFIAFSYRLYLARRQERILNNISELKGQVERLRSKEARYLLVKQKLQFVAEVMKEPGTRYDLATKVYDLARKIVEVRSVSIDEAGLSISGEAPDVFALVDFIQELQEFSQERGVGAIQGESFARTTEGSYRFFITLELEGI